MLRPRVVSSPDGDRWKIRRRWLDRPVPKIREAIRTIDERSPLDRSSLDLWAITDLGDDSDGFSAAIATAAAVVVIAFIFLPVIGLALELTFLVLIVFSGIVGRVLLRRPWMIEVVNLDRPGRTSLFAVGGWRRSGEAIEALAQRIPVSGVPPDPPEGTPLTL